ncbi:HSP20-like chaperone [Trematosphaeria pertusa]|uniref:HSP20-like chaperone n=1 Tax=Trematosphaeria pertusa TaxID=390896 RepID=A0A6A6J192_9PLEO|nr:HSP20-like chaperone [Trematosphaeria pertusa]KAF2256544.1 HSP20-like chaperone [Trematosphaeria pertusa]
MAFFLTPRFAPAYTAQCSPWGCAPAQPSYRRISRPSFPSFVPFLSQVDELLSELDREARREAHRQRQQRKRAFRARFDVRENEEGYQIDAEVPGFEQENIEIEVTDENTLRVAGNTEKKVEHQPQPTEAAPQDGNMDGATLNEPEPEATGSGAATPTHSDTESHKSYQATVEDDYEDLGAETSSTLSGVSTPPQPKESKGKEKAVDKPTTNSETAPQQQSQPEAPTQQQEQLSEQFHGSFERTFRFTERVNAANVRASLRDGLLSITVPKAKAPEVRRITIQ